MDREKKMKAAITGVLYYLKEEQERRAPYKKADQPNFPGSWAFYSRQLTMINRDRFQRRVVKR